MEPDTRSSPPGGISFSISAHSCQNVNIGPGEIQIDIITASDSQFRGKEKLPSSLPLVLHAETTHEPSLAQQRSPIVASQNASTGPGEIQIDIIISSDSEPRGKENLPSVLHETPHKSSPPQQEGSILVNEVASEESRRVALVLANPIIKNIRDQELGKMMLGASVPMTTAFAIYFFYVKSPPFIVRFVIVLLSIACTTIFNGLLLRDYCPLTATFMEVIGIAIVLLVVHAIVGTLLPSGFRWIAGIICVSTIAPFIVAAIAVIVPPANPGPGAHDMPD